jgi:hypothetical protein
MGSNESNQSNQNESNESNRIINFVSVLTGTTKYGFKGTTPLLGTRAEYRQKCTRFSTMPGAVRTHMAVLTVPHGEAHTMCSAR